MLVFPNAKINLGLDIIEKRSDGFHNIETVFYPVPIKDALEIVKSDKNESTLTISGITVDCEPEKNLCMRAFRLLQQKYKLHQVDIFLHKNIPFGAGLGGGSADAASVLIVLNKIFSLNISNEELMLFASQLGSDCAFFIKNKPQFASGKGEILSDIDVNLSGLFFVLVKPPIAVGTAQAYKNTRPQMPQIRIKNIIKTPVDTWKNALKNDFESSVFAQFPQIAKIKQTLYNKGAMYASMSGSGSSVFGIFSKQIAIDDFETENFVFSCQL